MHFYSLLFFLAVCIPSMFSYRSPPPLSPAFLSVFIYVSLTPSICISPSCPFPLIQTLTRPRSCFLPRDGELSLAEAREPAGQTGQHSLTNTPTENKLGRVRVPISKATGSNQFLSKVNEFLPTLSITELSFPTLTLPFLM